MSPAAAAAMMPAVSRAGVGRHVVDVPDARRPRRAPRRRATGRPPGSSAPSAPASSAPRSPARRGTQASRAPVAAARSAAARSAPGDRGEALTDEDDAAVGRPASGLAPTSVEPRGRAAPRPRGRGRSAAACRPPWPGRASRWDATAYTCVLCLRNALRRRRKTIGLSSSGSKPTSSTALARLEVGVGDRAAVGAGGDDVLGEEVDLLGRVRAGAEVDVVGAEHDAGELAVGVGVLGATRGHRRARRRPWRATRPAAAAARASGQPTTVQLAVGVAHHRAARCGRAAWRR